MDETSNGIMNKIMDKMDDKLNAFNEKLDFLVQSSPLAFLQALHVHSVFVDGWIFVKRMTDRPSKDDVHHAGKTQTEQNEVRSPG